MHTAHRLFYGQTRSRAGLPISPDVYGGLEILLPHGTRALDLVNTRTRKIYKYCPPIETHLLSIKILQDDIDRSRGAQT